MGGSNVSKICKTRGKGSAPYLESKLLQVYFTLHFASITSTSEFKGVINRREK